MKTVIKIAKWTLIFWGVVGLVFVGLWYFSAPAELPDDSQANVRLQQADFQVGQLELVVVDQARPTPALGDFSGADQRVLNGAIWYPESESTNHPVVIYSHGFGGQHTESSHLAKHLAANGYVVAAVDFPLSHMGSPAGVPQLLDVANQAGDVSAVIDHVLQLNNDASSELYQRIDTTMIGAMGLSLGGLTTALVSFHPDMKDERIGAAVMMAPPLDAFSELFYASNVTIQSMVLSGTYDRVVPEPANAIDIMPRHPKGWFVSLDKGSHLGFADIANPLRWMDNPDDLGCALMDIMLARQELPERWDAVISNTGGVLRDVLASQPCPELPGEAMNGLRQQWLTRVVVTAFFDMHLRSDDRVDTATDFIANTLNAEISDVKVTLPRRNVSR